MAALSSAFQATKSWSALQAGHRGVPGPWPREKHAWSARARWTLDIPPAAAEEGSELCSMAVDHRAKPGRTTRCTASRVPASRSCQTHEAPAPEPAIPGSTTRAGSVVFSYAAILVVLVSVRSLASAKAYRKETLLGDFDPLAGFLSPAPWLKLLRSPRKRTQPLHRMRLACDPAGLVHADASDGRRLAMTLVQGHESAFFERCLRGLDVQRAKAYIVYAERCLDTANSVFRQVASTDRFPVPTTDSR